MQNYKTVEEMAALWGITPRHVQYLCRKGKFSGAIKRAGAWFIPEDTPIPNKNTKSDAKGFRFVGTKSKIFESAIKLFMLRGFSSVSLRDIASDVGVRQSTIYNHFKSKQEILDTIYDYYCHYYLDNRPSLAHMESLMSNSSTLEIIMQVRYDFGEEHKQKMSDISKIVFQRVATDERAREIAKMLMIDEGIKYVQDVFDIGINAGRFAQFDTREMSVLINSIRLYTFIQFLVNPAEDNVALMLNDERKLFKAVAGLIPNSHAYADAKR